MWSALHMWLAVALVLVCAPLSARAGGGTYTLRFGTVAPEGSVLGRDLKILSDEVAARTHDKVRVRWMYNGIAGDELEQGERIARGQLDGSAGGQMLCNRIMPSMAVTRIPGMFQSRDEAVDALNRLQPALEREAHARGFVLLSAPGLGADVFLTRTPVHDLEELRRIKLWRWDLDEVGIATARAMGLHVVPTPLATAARAYDRGELDGFVAIPVAALAFQWSARARYVTDLRASYVWGCFIITEAAFHRLPFAERQVLKDAAARSRERFEESGKQSDEALLSGLFARHGVESVPVSERFRADYTAAAREARERVPAKLVPRALMDRVLQMLADYRVGRPSKP